EHLRFGVRSPGPQGFVHVLDSPLLVVPRAKHPVIWLEIQMGVEECVVRDPPERIRVIAAGGPQIVGAAPNCRPEHCKGSVILALQRGPKGLHWKWCCRLGVSAGPW